MVRRSRKVIWSDDALNGRIQILEYWKNRNKSTAYSKKLDKLFVKKLSEIADYPFIGRITNMEHVRTVVVRDCLLVYKILEDTILVLSVWEGHQNPDNFTF